MKIKSQPTDPKILALIANSVRPLTPEEVYKQRISFIVGSLPANSKVTREEIERVLAEEEGRKPDPHS